MMQPNEVSLLYATLVTITILGTVVGIVESAECSDSVKGRVLMTLAFAVLPSIALTMAIIFASFLINIIKAFT